ncbi:MAG TPA: 4-hydroxy-tetrahydrodipicolinate reductase, partial [Dehalococcoidia bacterium]|nr:4-hydroxy-tetrahydrodipicolinate reductase [Dehalococcoidia bacterium]
MTPIRVAVNGAAGRMGQEVVKAVCLDHDTQLVGAIESRVSDEYLALPDG